MNTRKGWLSLTNNAAILITNIGAALKKLAMSASDNSKNFTRFKNFHTSSGDKRVACQATQVRPRGKYHLLKIVKTLGGSPPSTHNATQANRKSKKWANCLKLWNPNRYCFSCGYEVTENHTSATCNQKTENCYTEIKFINAMRSNALGGSTRNEPTANIWKGG